MSDLWKLSKLVSDRNRAKTQAFRAQASIFLLNTLSKQSPLCCLSLLLVFQIEGCVLYLPI